MAIYTAKEARIKIEKEIKQSDHDIFILSAFVTIPALKWLEKIVPKNIKIKIAARWKLYDLISEASNIEAYKFCKDRQWSFGVDTQMHTKVYYVNKKIFIGSSNLTSKGLGLMGMGNREFNTSLDKPENADIQKVKDQEKFIIWLDDNTFKKISDEYKKNKKNNINDNKIKFSNELSKLLSPEIEHLWINDLKKETPEETIKDHIDNISAREIEDLKDDFIESKLFNWIKQRLIEDKKETHTNFGWLSSKLHNALIDEPPPYRKDVKLYVDILFQWIDFACKDTIEIKQWAKTKSLHLK